MLSLTEEAVFLNFIANFVGNKPAQADNPFKVNKYESATGNTTISYLFIFADECEISQKPVLWPMRNEAKQDNGSRLPLSELFIAKYLSEEDNWTCRSNV